MLELKDVTLVLIETREHELSRLALEDCERRARFAETLVFTDKPSYFAGQNRRIIDVPDWPNKIGWSRCFWYDVPLQVQTSHALCIQWDSWVVDPEMWREDYLAFDYVGAPWWYKDGMNVGNGGFCLRSTKFMRYIRNHRDQFPCLTDLDDDLYCRKYRPSLQNVGFEWAPDPIAHAFAFEVTRPDPDARHFGFHAVYNFNYGCQNDDQKLLERAKVMARSNYITKTNPYLWKGLIKAAPHLEPQLEDIRNG